MGLYDKEARVRAVALTAGVYRDMAIDKETIDPEAFIGKPFHESLEPGAKRIGTVVDAKWEGDQLVTESVIDDPEAIVMMKMATRGRRARFWFEMTEEEGVVKSMRGLELHIDTDEEE